MSVEPLVAVRWVPGSGSTFPAPRLAQSGERRRRFPSRELHHEPPCGWVFYLAATADADSAHQANPGISGACAESDAGQLGSAITIGAGACVRLILSAGCSRAWRAPLTNSPPKSDSVPGIRTVGTVAVKTRRIPSPLQISEAAFFPRQSSFLTARCAIFDAHHSSSTSSRARVVATSCTVPRRRRLGASSVHRHQSLSAQLRSPYSNSPGGLATI
jgi:hypothetical protein